MYNKEDGAKYIHTLMHTLIECVAEGIYVDIDDLQEDCKEYLDMERVVNKLSNWNPSKDNIKDIAVIFEGMSKSMAKAEKIRKEKAELEEVTSTEDYLTTDDIYDTINSLKGVLNNGEAKC